ncbi:MAG: metalloregulator ArsR/SmtB family transcription factor [Planctomycetota bacterium]|nr:metalloregulator ArsR/SmtB family transcription factor [Planctomycetota bacterium]
MEAANDFSCAEILKVLADETRLAVVRQLMNGPKHVGEMNEELKVESTLLSHHLRVLRDAGIVEGERDGKAVLYRLSPDFESKRRGAALELGCCRLVFE